MEDRINLEVAGYHLEGSTNFGSTLITLLWTCSPSGNHTGAKLTAVPIASSDSPLAEGDEETDERRSTVTSVAYRHPVIGCVLTFFAIFTVVGNVLVIVAVVKERYLRATVTNYFIVSLGLADLIIGAVVMPFSISLEITNNRWLFGTDWCDLWHSFDVLASTASILNLSVIALDRYWAIMDPIAYPGRMTSGRAFILIGVVWISSAAISFPAIAWWRSVLREPVPDWMCSFTEDSGYLIFSSMVSFYFPVSVILFAYYRIYRAASEQIQSLKRGTKIMSSGDGVNGEVMTLRIHRGGVPRATVARATSAPPASTLASFETSSCSSDTDNNGVGTTGSVGSPCHLVKEGTPGARHYTLTTTGELTRPSRIVSRRWKHFAVSRKLSKVIKEQKAAKTLGIVMGVFCMCWVPFFVTNFLFGVCHHLDCVYHADVLFRVFAWLGYLNSGMNPVIYACSMREFRRAFLRLCCYCCCPRGYDYQFVARRSYSAGCHSHLPSTTLKLQGLRNARHLCPRH